MQKLKMHTPDITDENIDKIALLFPNCVTEARQSNGCVMRAIDFDQLRQELTKFPLVEGGQERYQLNWPGKNNALIKANTPIFKTLRPCREESINFDSTNNLFIEGDNLEALKLLQETYLNKIKMIYIDPPYNTGNDFIYRDNFSRTINSYEIMSQQLDEDGYRMNLNSETNGRFHSDWLSMMYSRLKLAKNLLTDDGVIFISIDDGEIANLKKICDEIFGAENYINTISINMKNAAGASGGGEDKKLKKNLEYLLIYAKNYYSFSSFDNVYEYVPIDELVNKYRDEGISWKYTSILVYEGDKKYIGSAKDGDGNEIKIYARENPIIKSISQMMNEHKLSEAEVYKKYANKIFQTAMPQSSIRPRVMEKVRELGYETDMYSIEYVPKSGRNKEKLYEQFYKGSNFRLFAWLKDVAEEIDGVLYKKELQGTYWNFASDTKNLTKEGNIPFPNAKKPLALLKRILSMLADKDCIVLDFFAGSSTTAHAVLELNKEDGGTRQFIMVQVPELCDKRTDAYKAGYLNIAQISKARINYVVKNIQSDYVNKLGIEKVDLGFRVLKIDSSNMRDVYYNPNAESQTNLLANIENILKDRTPEDLLFQVMLDWGIDLTLPITIKKMFNKTVFFVDLEASNTLTACFETSISESLVKKIAAYKPSRMVFRDSSFESDSLKINVEQIFKHLSPDTEIRIL